MIFYYSVPGERIELPTFGLQNRCSTAELTRLAGMRAISVAPSPQANAAQPLRLGSARRRCGHSKTPRTVCAGRLSRRKSS